jgi:hypothetical protein
VTSATSQSLFGQGDSGGPVIRIIDGAAYATGVISTISNANLAPCPGYTWQGRQCGAVGSLQTVSSWLAANPTWGVAIAP